MLGAGRGLAASAGSLPESPDNGLLLVPCYGELKVKLWEYLVLYRDCSTPERGLASSLRSTGFFRRERIERV